MGCSFSMIKIHRFSNTIFQDVVTEVDRVLCAWENFSDSSENVMIKALHWARDEKLSLEAIMKFQAVANLSTDICVIIFPYLGALKEVKCTLSHIANVCNEMDHLQASIIESARIQKNPKVGRVEPELLGKQLESEKNIIQLHESTSKLHELLNVDFLSDLNHLVSANLYVNQSLKRLSEESAAISALISEGMPQKVLALESVSKLKLDMEICVELLDNWLSYTQKCLGSLKQIHTGEVLLFRLLKRLVHNFSIQKVLPGGIFSTTAVPNLVNIIGAQFHYAETVCNGKHSLVLLQMLGIQSQTLVDGQSNLLFRLGEVKLFQEGTNEFQKDQIVQSIQENNIERVTRIVRAQKGIASSMLAYFACRSRKLDTAIHQLAPESKIQILQFQKKTFKIYSKNERQVCSPEKLDFAQVKEAIVPEISIISIEDELFTGEVLPRDISRLHPGASLSTSFTSREKKNTNRKQSVQNLLE